MDEQMLAKLGEISAAIEKRLSEGEKVSKDAEGDVTDGRCAVAGGLAAARRAAHPGEKAT